MAETMIGIKPIHERILVAIYDNGDTSMMLGGKKFYLLDDSDGASQRDTYTRHRGIRPRRAVVLATSDSVQEQGGIEVGDKVLLDELKWSRGMPARINGYDSKIWSIPFEDVLGVYEGESLDATEKEQMTQLYPDWETWEAVEA